MDTFTVLTADSINGTFDTILAPTFAGIFTFDVQYNAADVTLAVTAQLLAGDANNDGVVTGADLIAVQQNFAGTGPADGLLLGDANDDGQVTGADLVIVQQNFGAALGPVGLVPEPAAAAVLLLAPLWIRRTRR